jgi:osmotically-inducible protein OsmY
MSTDGRLQEQALEALERELGVDAAQVGVSAHDGVVTLRGIVATFRQKWLAERAARRLPDVRAVANDLEVAIVAESQVGLGGLRARIEAALRQAAEIDAHGIAVDAHGGTVVLSGVVHSASERDAAERAALATPGVNRVDDRLIVAP